jgi:hypothetical protein
MAKKTDLIAYCGHYCGTCPAHTQEVAELTKNLRSRLRKDKFDKYASVLAKVPAFKAFKHYDKGCDLLNALMKMRCKNGTCRDGGWSLSCKIKKCAEKKGLLGCWQCDDFPTCKTLKVLEEGDDKTHLRNLRKIKRIGPAAFVRQQASARR